jgi:hypothetical protein
MKGPKGRTSEPYLLSLITLSLTHQWITILALFSSEKIFLEARAEKLPDLEGKQEVAILRGGFADFQQLYKVLKSHPSFILFPFWRAQDST